MAEDRYRRTDGPGATAARAAPRTDPATDPLVELARLIGQNEPVAYEPSGRVSRMRDGLARDGVSDRATRDGVESRIERGPAPSLRRSEPAAPRLPEPPQPDPVPYEPGYPEPRFGRSPSDYARGGGEPRYADPSLDTDARHPDQRYSGYTEPPPPRASAADPRRGDPPAWLTARAEVPPEPRAAETGWRAPRSRDAAPPPPAPAAEPAWDAGYADPHGRPLDAGYAAAEPMFTGQPEPLAMTREDALEYDPRYAPAADGAFEAGETYDPTRDPARDRDYYGAAYDGRYPAEDDARAEPPSRRRGFMVAAAILAVAVVGTAGAYGWRSMKGGPSEAGGPPVVRADTSPKKIASAVQGGDKQIYERVGGGQNERLVPREEQPVAVRDVSGDATSNLPPQVSAPATVPSAAPGDPKRIRTVTIRPESEANQGRPPAATPVAPAPARPAAAAPAAAAPARPAGNAPMAITPQAAPAAAPAPAARTAMTTPVPSAAETGGYVVQLSAQKTPEEARASFRAMQSKYPSVLSDRQVLVKKKDLGAKGIYYGSQVGPFASRDSAIQLCESLKAAGGNCLVQKN